ncbi:MAG: choline-sulfatase, partial [Planctomycetota bacterium]
MTTRTKRALRSAALLGTSLACFACGPRSDAGTPMNVIVICLDTVRADHLGCYGYEKRETTPFMDSLAERSVLFEDASSTAGWTKPSVPSILTGMLPLQHGVYRGSARSENGAVSDVLADEALTLAEVYSERGYQSAAFVRNAQLRRGLGFEQGFDLYRDKAGDAREIRWRTSDWLDERDTQRPFFLYLHYLDAHWPYPVPEEYATRFTSPEQVEFLRSSDWRRLRDAVNDGAEQLSDDQLDALLALYDGALRYIDDELARLWEKLERDGLADDTIICIVADHGEEFMEHGRIGHGNGLYETLL